MTQSEPKPDPFPCSGHFPIAVMISILTVLLAGAFRVIFARYRSRKPHYTLPAERLSMREVET
jgi:hypothetical protein